MIPSDGLYILPVKTKISGDFTIEVYVGETDMSRKAFFRYAGTTCFIEDGVRILDRYKVDILDDSIDFDNFFVEMVRISSLYIY